MKVWLEDFGQEDLDGNCPQCGRVQYDAFFGPVRYRRDEWNGEDVVYSCFSDEACGNAIESCPMSFSITFSGSTDHHIDESWTGIKIRDIKRSVYQMKEPLYAERWLVKDKKPLKPLSRAKAEQRHASREPYIAILGGLERPSHVISVVGPWIAVTFFDADVRDYLLYSFREVRPGQLFLKQAIHREYTPDSDEASSVMIFAFDEAGQITMEHQDFVRHSIESREATADPSLNWDRYPDFGDYGHLTQTERGVAV